MSVYSDCNLLPTSVNIFLSSVVSLITMTMIWFLVPLKPVEGKFFENIKDMDWMGSILSLAMTLCLLVCNLLILALEMMLCIDKAHRRLAHSADPTERWWRNFRLDEQHCYWSPCRWHSGGCRIYSSGTIRSFSTPATGSTVRKHSRLRSFIAGLIWSLYSASRIATSSYY